MSGAWESRNSFFNPTCVPWRMTSKNWSIPTSMWCESVNRWTFVSFLLRSPVSNLTSAFLRFFRSSLVTSIIVSRGRRAVAKNSFSKEMNPYPLGVRSLRRDIVSSVMPAHIGFEFYINLSSDRKWSLF